MKVCKHITQSDLTANPGEVLVLDTVEIFSGKPDESVLAGIWLPDGDGPGLPQVVMVLYHFGYKSWTFVVEHSKQIATKYEPLTLQDAVATFEKRTGCTLPAIRVIEYGVGVYSAQSRYVTDNPFALVDGGFYQVRDPKRGSRQFVADVRNGHTRITFCLNAKGETIPDETYDPAVVLSLADWRSLTRLPE